MKIQSLALFEIAVPLKAKIQHASHERDSSDNVLARVVLADGSVGYGEGVPRDYVTGETVASVFAHWRERDLARIVGDCRTYPEVAARWRAWDDPAPDPRGIGGNAARCAAELAVLDAYGRHFGASVGDLIAMVAPTGVPLAATPQNVRYSGAITAGSSRRERISAWKMRLYGFRDVKLKVGVAGQDDPARLHTLRRILGRSMDLRLDANESWPASAAAERVAELKFARPSVLEQPIAHAEISALADLRPRLGVPVMLDESFCGWRDAQDSLASKNADFWNVRISKCGGILRCLDLIALANQHGIGLQLGCHPGETGVLSAAGRHLASRVTGIRYLEGSYDRHILSTQFTTPDITFRYGGRARPLAGTGLGVRVVEETCAPWIRRQWETTYE